MKQALTCLGSYQIWQAQQHSVGQGFLPLGPQPRWALPRQVSLSCQLALSWQPRSTSFCLPAALAWTTRSRILAPICLCQSLTAPPVHPRSLAQPAPHTRISIIK